MAEDTVESAGQFQEKQPPIVPEEDAKLVKEVRDALQFAKAYDDEQRKAEQEQEDFQLADQWPQETRNAREGGEDESGGKIPEKPTLTADLLDSQIQQVVTEARQARLAITVRPKAGLATSKTADHFKGLIRTIQVNSGAQAVRLWALERTARVGRGAYLVSADYENDADFDLDLTIERILDQGTVYWDPYSQAADHRDAEWCILTDWLSRKRREERWPDKPIVKAEASLDEDSDDDWFGTDPANPKQERCRIATMFRVVRTRKTLAYHPDHGAKLLEEMPEDARRDIDAAKGNTKTREVETRKVEILTVDGTQVLERKPWLGRFIPVIGTVGKEYFLGGKRRWKGMIASGMDLQKAINVVLSAAVEVAGQSPRTPFIMAEGQDEGHEDMWDDVTVKAYTRIYYRAMELAGKQVPPPSRLLNEPQLQGLMLLLRVLVEMFHNVMGSVAPQARAVNPYDRSGAAIEALQRQGQAGTAYVLDNLATISMPYEGMVLVDAIPAYYDKPGRVLHIEGEDGSDGMAVMIRRPFVQKDGHPVPVPCPQCRGRAVIEGPPTLGLGGIQLPGVPMTCPACVDDPGFATEDSMPEEIQGLPVQYIDFSEGEFTVQPVVDKNYQTKQEEALAGMAQLAGAAPAMVPAFAATWVRAMGFSGANRVAEDIEAAFPKPGQDDEGLANLPAAVRARVQQLMQQHQQAMQALEQAQKIIETDAVKTAGQKEIAALREGMRLRVEQLKAQQSVLEQGRDLAAERGLEEFRQRMETLRQEMEHRHELLIQRLDQIAAENAARMEHANATEDDAASRARDARRAASQEADPA